MTLYQNYNYLKKQKRLNPKEKQWHTSTQYITILHVALGSCHFSKPRLDFITKRLWKEIIE